MTDLILHSPHITCIISWNSVTEWRSTAGLFTTGDDDQQTKKCKTNNNSNNNNNMQLMTKRQFTREHSTLSLALTLCTASYQCFVAWGRPLISDRQFMKHLATNKILGILTFPNVNEKLKFHRKFTHWLHITALCILKADKKQWLLIRPQ